MHLKMILVSDTLKIENLLLVLLPQAKHMTEITLYQNVICLYNLKCYKTNFYL